MIRQNKTEKVQELKELVREKRIRAARSDFWTYCQIKAPDFYKSDRPFLRNLCRELQDFCLSDDEVMIVNMPPRHGKSRTVGCLVEWILGQDSSKKIMTGSYNETLSTTFSKNVRNSILEQKADQSRIVYSDIFPNTRIKRGDGAMNMWSLEGGYNNYLATSPTGTATGFGADVLIIDDLIKNALEAYTEITLEAQWLWYTNTMLSRLESGAKVIVVMTRWHNRDLAGRMLEFYKQQGSRLRHVSYKADQDDGTMLCEQILSRKEYEGKISAMGLEIASANYQQEPIDIKGKLYSRFKTYDKLPEDADGNSLLREIRNYTDTADTGSDYLCSIDYGVYRGEAYILDVLFTKKPMELTEPAQAEMMFKDGVNVAHIESNNGGRGYGRNVARLMWETYGSNQTVFKPFTQTKNKSARIYSNSTWVMEHIYFPANWKDRFPEYYESMNSYQKEGKNAHDDAQDATTGVAEMTIRSNSRKQDPGKQIQTLKRLGL